MAHRTSLSDAEWELVVELLERERTELPAEIRHTRTRSVRQQLRQREQLVGELLERMREAAVVG
jgi:hypothetical protein